MIHVLAAAHSQADADGGIALLGIILLIGGAAFTKKASVLGGAIMLIGLICLITAAFKFGGGA